MFDQQWKRESTSCHGGHHELLAGSGILRRSLVAHYRSGRLDHEDCRVDRPPDVRAEPVSLGVESLAGSRPVSFLSPRTSYRVFSA